MGPNATVSAATWSAVGRDLFWLAMGGAGGAVARYLVILSTHHWLGPAFPWGTWVVNVTGSCLIGFTVGWLQTRLAGAGPAVATHIQLLIMTGFLGSFTTFSTYMMETHRLMASARWLPALANVFGQITLGLAGVVLGLALARLILPAAP